MQLEQRVSQLEKLSQQLLGRICELEDQQGDLQDQIKKLQNKNQLLEQEVAGLKNKTEEIQESWLFYCDIVLFFTKLIQIQIKSLEIERPLNSIKQTLQIESDIVKEFDYQSWLTEEIMWRQIIKNISKEQQKDLEKINGAQLKQLAVQKLKENIDNEVLFVLLRIQIQTKWFSFRLNNTKCEQRK